MKPFASFALLGVTWMKFRSAPVTVNGAEPVNVPLVAVILTAPAFLAIAKPLEPDVLLTSATLASEDAQVTLLVRFCVLLSVKMPVAVNCKVVPFAAEDDDEVTEML